MTSTFNQNTGLFDHISPGVGRDGEARCRRLMAGPAGALDQVDQRVAERNTRDHYQSFLRQLGWPGADLTCPRRTLAFTSSQPGEGVSTVATNVALAAAQLGIARVLLVDANLASPSLHQIFGLELDSRPTEETASSNPRRIFCQSTVLPNLKVVTAGSLNLSHGARADEVLAHFSRMVSIVKRSVDLVVFDMPAVSQAGPTIHLYRLFDGTALVTEAEVIRWEVALRSKKHLDGAGANLIGVVLNKRVHHIPNWLYQTL